MTCNNMVNYSVVQGYGSREVTTRCGLTNYWGDRATCNTCASDPVIVKDNANHEANVAFDEWDLRQWRDH